MNAGQLRKLEPALAVMLGNDIQVFSEERLLVDGMKAQPSPRNDEVEDRRQQDAVAGVLTTLGAFIKTRTTRSCTRVKRKPLGVL